MKVIVSFQILEEYPNFNLCGIVGVILEEKTGTVIIDFGTMIVEVKKKYVQNIRGESIWPQK